MTKDKKKYYIIFSILFILLILSFLVYIYTNKLEKDSFKAEEPITINLPELAEENNDFILNNNNNISKKNF